MHVGGRSFPFLFVATISLSIASFSCLNALQDGTKVDGMRGEELLHVLVTQWKVLKHVHGGWLMIGN